MVVGVVWQKEERASSHCSRFDVMEVKRTMGGAGDSDMQEERG